MGLCFIIHSVESSWWLSLLQATAFHIYPYLLLASLSQNKSEGLLAKPPPNAFGDGHKLYYK
jgi:hypothetical protein